MKTEEEENFSERENHFTSEQNIWQSQGPGRREQGAVLSSWPPVCLYVVIKAVRQRQTVGPGQGKTNNLENISGRSKWIVGATSGSGRTAAAATFLKLNII